MNIFAKRLLIPGACVLLFMGTFVSAAPIVINEDGGPHAPEYTEVGTWFGPFAEGYDNDDRVAELVAGAATAEAMFTFNGLNAGASHKVWVTWPAVVGSRPFDAPYTVSGISGGDQTFIFDQNIAPASGLLLTGPNAGGERPFELLGTFQTTGTSLVVTVSNSTASSTAARFVIADAVAVEEVVPHILGDVNDDNLVDGVDFEIIRSNFFGVDVGRSLGDLNEDGKVDLRDYGEWKDNFPFPLTALAASVPEPSSVGLAVMGVAIVGLVRRRLRMATV